jgi:predicted nucleic acid-binding protein
MNVVDSSGWLEYFAKASNAAFFRPAIHDTQALLVPTICIYEVYKRIAAQRDEEEALAAVAWMSVGQVIDLTQQIALLAADLSFEHGLAMADSVIYATARIHQATLWTQDAHFARLEGVRYVKK